MAGYEPEATVLKLRCGGQIRSPLVPQGALLLFTPVVVQVGIRVRRVRQIPGAPTGLAHPARQRNYLVCLEVMQSAAPGAPTSRTPDPAFPADGATHISTREPATAHTRSKGACHMRVQGYGTLLSSLKWLVSRRLVWLGRGAWRGVPLCHTGLPLAHCPPESRPLRPDRALLDHIALAGL